MTTIFSRAITCKKVSSWDDNFNGQPLMRCKKVVMLRTRFFGALGHCELLLGRFPPDRRSGCSIPKAKTLLRTAVFSVFFSSVRNRADLLAQVSYAELQYVVILHYPPLIYWGCACRLYVKQCSSKRKTKQQTDARCLLVANRVRFSLSSILESY